MGEIKDMHKTQAIKANLSLTVLLLLNITIMLGILTGRIYLEYIKKIHYEKSLIGHIDTQNDLQHPERIKDGTILWLTGYIASRDFLSVNLRDLQENVYQQYRDTALWLQYKEVTSYLRPSRSGLKPGDYQETVVSQHTYIGAFYVSPDLVRMIKKSDFYQDQVFKREFYNYQRNYKLVTTVKAQPNHDISCLVMWKNGMLQKTAPNDPFVFCFARDFRPEQLFRQYLNKAKLVFYRALIYFVFVFSLLIACYIIYRRKKGETSGHDDQEDGCMQRESCRFRRLSTYCEVICVFVSILLTACSSALFGLFDVEDIKLILGRLFGFTLLSMIAAKIGITMRTYLIHKLIKN